MTGEPGDADALLGRLRQQTRQLVAELPGPLRRVRMRSGGSMVEVEWPDAGGPAGCTATGTRGDRDDAHDRAASAAAGAPEPGPGDPVGAGAGSPAGGRDVRAPIVGTFYRAPEPGADPFVQVGDLVEAGQVVGIVEAMKLMNQVTAEVAGQVTAVLARDGEAVQFGQPLIRLAIA